MISKETLAWNIEGFLGDQGTRVASVDHGKWRFCLGHGEVVSGKALF